MTGRIADAMRAARTEPKPPPEAAVPAPVAAPEARHARRGAGRRTDALEVTTMHIGVTTRERLRAYCTSTGLTHDHVICVAVSETKDAGKAWFPGAVSPLGDGQRRRRRFTHAEPQVPIGPRLSRAQVDAIDRIVREAMPGQAPVRSVYVDRALSVWLDQHT